MIPDKLYDILKWVAMIVLPALATAVSAIFGLWDIPYAEPIAGTITAIATFMGAILMVSSKNYYGDGTLVVDTTDPETDSYSLNLTTALETLPQKDKITLKVESQSAES